jgi:hypothetical protein
MTAPVVNERGGRPPALAAQVARQRAIEALHLSGEAEAHLLRCLTCQCALRLCREGTALVAVARVARVLAVAHVKGKA